MSTAGSRLRLRRVRTLLLALAACVAAVYLFALGWLVVDPLAVSPADAWRMTSFGITFAFAVVLWTEGRARPEPMVGVDEVHSVEELSKLRHRADFIVVFIPSSPARGGWWATRRSPRFSLWLY